MLCPQCCGQFLLLFTHFCSCIICISLIAELLETLTGWTRWMPVHCRAAAWLLQRSSCLTYLFTWSLTLIIIDEYDDMILLYPVERMRKLEGVTRGSEGEKVKERECTGFYRYGH